MSDSSPTPFPHGPGTLRALCELGLRAAWSRAGFWQCLLEGRGERWIGAGTSRSRALEHALLQAFPSQASQTLLRERVASRPAARALDPGAARARADDALREFEIPTPAPADREPAGPARAELLPFPEPPGATQPARSAEPEALARPPGDDGVPRGEPDPPPPRRPQWMRLDETTALRRLDGLAREIEEHIEEACLLEPRRQRLLLTAWQADARDIEERCGENRVVSAVRRQAVRLAGLGKIWWPGSIRVLAIEATPTDCTVDLPRDLAARVASWRQLARSARHTLRALETEGLARGFDAFGWADGARLEPAPPDPRRMLHDVADALTRATGPIETPASARHVPPQELPRPWRLDGPGGWTETARKLRWLRVSVEDVGLWSAALGRLRWLADRDLGLQQLIDPQHSPRRAWATELGLDPTHARNKRRKRELLQRLEGLSPDVQPAELGALLREMFGLGDLLSNPRIVRALAHVRRAAGALTADDLGETGRKDRRRLKGIQKLLNGAPAAPEPAGRGVDEEPQDADAGPEPARPTDVAILNVQPHTRGKRALFVSNRDDPEVVDRLREAFQFREVCHCLPSPRRVEAHARRVGNGTFDLVLAATGFLPHQVDARLKQACVDVGIPYVRVNRGRPQACAKHIARELGVPTAV